MSSNPVSSLERACRILRLSGAQGPPAQLSKSGSGLYCRAADRTYPLRNGVVDLLEDRFRPTLGQRLLDTAPSARLYDLVRPHLGPVIGMPTFAEEVDNVARRLQLVEGDVVVDIACGHGNFTVELARIVGREGLVIGLDIAGAMLAERPSSSRIRCWATVWSSRLRCVTTGRNSTSCTQLRTDYARCRGRTRTDAKSC